MDILGVIELVSTAHVFGNGLKLALRVNSMLMSSSQGRRRKVTSEEHSAETGHRGGAKQAENNYYFVIDLALMLFLDMVRYALFHLEPGLGGITHAKLVIHCCIIMMRLVAAQTESFERLMLIGACLPLTFAMQVSAMLILTGHASGIITLTLLTIALCLAMTTRFISLVAKPDQHQLMQLSLVLFVISSASAVALLTSIEPELIWGLACVWVLLAAGSLLCVCAEEGQQLILMTCFLALPYTQWSAAHLLAPSDVPALSFGLLAPVDVLAVSFGQTKVNSSVEISKPLVSEKDAQDFGQNLDMLVKMLDMRAEQSLETGQKVDVKSSAEISNSVTGASMLKDQTEISSKGMFAALLLIIALVFAGEADEEVKCDEDAESRRRIIAVARTIAVAYSAACFLLLSMLECAFLSLVPEDTGPSVCSRPSVLIYTASVMIAFILAVPRMERPWARNTVTKHKGQSEGIIRLVMGEPGFVQTLVIFLFFTASMTGCAFYHLAPEDVGSSACGPLIFLYIPTRTMPQSNPVFFSNLSTTVETMVMATRAKMKEEVEEELVKRKEPTMDETEVIEHTSAEKAKEATIAAKNVEEEVSAVSSNKEDTIAARNDEEDVSAVSSNSLRFSSNGFLKQEEAMAAKNAEEEVSLYSSNNVFFLFLLGGLSFVVIHEAFASFSKKDEESNTPPVTPRTPRQKRSGSVVVQGTLKEQQQLQRRRSTVPTTGQMGEPSSPFQRTGSRSNSPLTYQRKEAEEQEKNTSKEVQFSTRRVERSKKKAEELTSPRGDEEEASALAAKRPSRLLRHKENKAEEEVEASGTNKRAVEDVFLKRVPLNVSEAATPRQTAIDIEGQIVGASIKAPEKTQRSALRTQLPRLEINHHINGNEKQPQIIFSTPKHDSVIGLEGMMRELLTSNVDSSVPAHGYGVHSFPCGSRYDGSWKEGTMCQGKFRFVQGHVFDGEWHDGQPSGHGTFTWADGSIFKGQFRNTYPDGQGIKVWPHGDSYSGQWLAGVKHGFGKYSWSKGASYSGAWAEDKIHGHGTYTFENGDSYTGLWNSDEIKKPAVGTYRWTNGSECRVFCDETVDICLGETCQNSTLVPSECAAAGTVRAASLADTTNTAKSQ